MELEFYPRDYLDTITPEYMAEFSELFLDFDVICHPDSVRVRHRDMNAMLRFKEVLEYKYLMPIQYRWKHKELVFNGYSAWRFLNMIESCLTDPRKATAARVVMDNTLSTRCKLYAAGAIEHAPDKGVNYRKDLKLALRDTPFDVVDPCDFNYNNIQGVQKTLIEHAAENSLVDSYWHTRDVVKGDLGAVIETDATIVLLDEYMMQGSGTKSELSVAMAVKRPVYGILRGLKLEDITPWTRSCVTRYFKSMEELKRFATT